MINTDQFNRLINDNDDALTAAINLATHADAELHAMLTDADALHAAALDADCTPATIARIAEYLTTPDHFVSFCNDYELCIIHRCDYQICIDDELHR